MNIIDIFVIAFILLYVLNGVYRGFLPSVLNIVGFFTSWIAAYIFSPGIASRLAANETVSSLRFYIEGAEKVGDFELAKRAISSFSQGELERVVANSQLTPPYNTTVLEHIKTRAFESQGLTTLGEYFDASIYTVITNIVAFVLLFVALRIIITLLINSYSYAASMPQLRHFDHLLGGAVSLARGFFSMYVVFSLIPIALIIIPVTFVTDIINSSVMSTIFYNGSIILRYLY